MLSKQLRPHIYLEVELTLSVVEITYLNILLQAHCTICICCFDGKVKNISNETGNHGHCDWDQIYLAKIV